MKLHKGDTVKIIVGKDRGKTGKISRVDSATGRIVVENLNLVKKHRRPRRQGEKGEIVSVARAVSGSNVMIVCPNCGKNTRIGYKLSGEGIARKKSRYCKKCEAVI